MNKDKTIKKEDYERASLLLGKLFEIESDVTDQINTCIQYHGVESFFKNLETFDFSLDIFEKLNAVRMVMNGMMEGGKESEEKL